MLVVVEVWWTYGVDICDSPLVDLTGQTKKKEDQEQKFFRFWTDTEVHRPF